MCRFEAPSPPWLAFRFAACAAAVLFLQACSESPPTARASVAGSSAAGEAPQAKPTQVAARVNAEELTVHQLNERLSAWTGGVGTSGVEDPAIGRGLNRLIELTLLRQEAEAQGLANKPEVMRQLMASRAEVLARAMAQQLGEEEATPTPQEARRYFDEHPQSFSKRQVFLLQELRVETEASAQQKLLQRLQEFRNPQSMARALERDGHRASVAPIQIGSDQLPIEQWKRLKSLEQGQAIPVDDPRGLRIWWLQASVDQPIEWVQAKPMIERLLGNQARAERIRREIERLRNTAKVEYVGDFARWSPSPEPKAASTPDSAQAAQAAAVGR